MHMVVTALSTVARYCVFFILRAAPWCYDRHHSSQIVDGEMSEQYVEALTALNKKLSYLGKSSILAARAAQDVGPTLEKLRLKVSALMILYRRLQDPSPNMWTVVGALCVYRRRLRACASSFLSG